MQKLYQSLSTSENIAKFIWLETPQSNNENPDVQETSLDYDDISDIENKFSSNKQSNQEDYSDDDLAFIQSVEENNKPAYANSAQKIINKIIADFYEKNPEILGQTTYEKLVKDPDGGNHANLVVDSNIRTGEQTLTVEFENDTQNDNLTVYKINFDTNNNCTLTKTVNGKIASITNQQYNIDQTLTKILQAM